MDLSVYAAWLRGPDISQNIQKRFKKYPKIDCRAFVFSRRCYTVDNRTARDIPNFGPFWVVKIQGGQCPPGPPNTNITALRGFWRSTLNVDGTHIPIRNLGGADAQLFL